MTRNAEYVVDEDAEKPYGIEGPARRKKMGNGTWREEVALADASGRVKWTEFGLFRSRSGEQETRALAACRRTLLTQTGPTCYMTSALNVLFTSAVTQEIFGTMLSVCLRKHTGLFNKLARPFASYFRVHARVGKKRLRSDGRPGADRKEDSDDDSEDEDDTETDFVTLVLKVALRVICRKSQAPLAIMPLLEVLGRKHRMTGETAAGGSVFQLLLEMFGVLGFTSFVTDERIGQGGEPLATPHSPVDFVFVQATKWNMANFLESKPAKSHAGKYLVFGGFLSLKHTHGATTVGYHSIEYLQCPTDGVRVVHNPTYADVVPYDWLVEPTRQVLTLPSIAPGPSTVEVISRLMLYINVDTVQMIRRSSTDSTLPEQWLANLMANTDFIV
jgi:hypothetical protein